MLRLRKSTASRCAVAATASVLLFGASTAQAKKPRVQLKMATVAPEGSAWMKVMRQIDREVREATDNAVGFKVYPGGVQGDETVVLRKVRAGQLHGGGLSGLGLGLIAPETRVMEVPFLFESHEEIDAAYGRIGDHLEERLEAGGFKLLGWVEIGFVYLFSKHPIATQADLKAAKMWLWEGDPLAESFYRQAGVVPVPLAVTDVMTSLQTRLIDAVYSSPYACIALQWFSRVSHYTDVPVTFASGAVVLSNKAFNKIPPAHRDTVLKICRTRFRELVETTRRQNAESLVEIGKNGVQRVDVSDAEVDRFREIGKRVWEAQIGKLYPRELLNQVVGAAHQPQ